MDTSKLIVYGEKVITWGAILTLIETKVPRGKQAQYKRDIKIAILSGDDKTVSNLMSNLGG